MFIIFIQTEVQVESGNRHHATEAAEVNLYQTCNNSFMKTQYNFISFSPSETKNMNLSKIPVVK